MKMNPLISIPILLLLNACASKEAISDSILTDIRHTKEISVASLLSDDIPMRFLGTTVFNNQDLYVDVPGWSINEFIVRFFDEALSSQGINVRPFKFDRARAQQLRDQTTAGVTGLFVGSNDDKARAYLVDKASQRGIKYLVTVTRGRNDNFAIYPPGYGVFCRAAFGSQGDAHAYGFYGLQIWDVSKKERIFYTSFTPESSMVKSGKSCEEVVKRNPDLAAREFRKYIEQSFQRTLRVALEEAGFINSLAKKK